MLASKMKAVIPASLQLDLRVAREVLTGEPEIRLLPTALSGGGTFVDVGANLGTYAAYARWFTGSVEIFEPHPGLAASLRMIFGDRAHVNEVALSDRTGNALFHIPVLGAREVHSRGSIEGCHAADFSQVHDIEVICRPLDDFQFDRVALIKVDVEGHELAVLRGAVKTIEAHQPLVIVEVEDFRMPGCFGDIRGLMRDLRYEGLYVHRGRIGSLDGFDIEAHQRAELRPHYGEKRDPEFVNNFVFQPEGQPRFCPGMAVGLRGAREAGSRGRRQLDPARVSPRRR